MYERSFEWTGLEANGANDALISHFFLCCLYLRLPHEPLQAMHVKPAVVKCPLCEPEASVGISEALRTTTLLSDSTAGMQVISLMVCRTGLCCRIEGGDPGGDQGMWGVGGCMISGAKGGTKVPTRRVH